MTSRSSAVSHSDIPFPVSMAEEKHNSRRLQTTRRVVWCKIFPARR